MPGWTHLFPSLIASREQSFLLEILSLTSDPFPLVRCGSSIWYEAYADVAGERTKLQVFAMRSMASGAAFHCAFAHATQQAFLEAHELAFCFFHGVFRKLRYDNLTAAVKKIIQGYGREEDSSVHGISFALAIPQRVLYAGGSARKRGR